MKRAFWIALIGIVFAPAAARAQSEEVVYYHTDAIGSVRMVTNASGVTLGRYDYTPFGQQWEVPENPDARQFAGKEHDDTGLDYFGARYYNGQLGRFTSVDPVLNTEAAMTDPQRWNRYAYVRSNPFVYVDPDGRELYRIITPGERDFMQFAASIRDRVDTFLGGPHANHPHAIFGRKVIDTLLSTVLPRDNAELAALNTAALMGVAGGVEARLKPVSLPAWKSVAIDMGEVISGHTSTGTRAVQSGMKSLFPDTMSSKHIEQAIRNAYRFGEKVATQGDRVQIRGPWQGGTIELWLNKATKTIETAYPLF